MALFRVRFVGQQDSGDSADDFIWSFGLDAPDAPTSAELGALLDVLDTALGTVVGSLTPRNLFQQGASIVSAEAYPAIGGEAVALAAASPAIAFGTGGAMPSEVALAISYMVETNRGPRPIGRTFLGPFSAQVLNAAFGTRIQTPEVQALVGMWGQVLTDLTLVNSSWTPVVINALGTVSRGEVIAVRADNAWDTMRSRGYEASTFTSIAVPIV